MVGAPGHFERTRGQPGRSAPHLQRSSPGGCGGSRRDPGGTCSHRGGVRHLAGHGGRRRVRFSIAPPDAAVIGTSALSPDGRHLAFTASGPDGTKLWIRPLVSVTPRAVPGTDEAAFPFWSADSRFVGFFAGGRLKMVAIAGGDVKTICDAPEGRGGAWNQDDVILFAPNREGPLFRVPASGGVPARVTHVDRALHRAHLWPEFLPDGQHFFYLADSTRPEHHAIFAGGLDQSPAKRLIAVESNAAFDGAHLRSMRNRTLLAQRFETRRLELDEEVVTVAEPVVRQRDRSQGRFLCVPHWRSHVPRRRHDSDPSELARPAGAAGRRIGRRRCRHDRAGLVARRQPRRRVGVRCRRRNVGVRPVAAGSGQGRPIALHLRGRRRVRTGLVARRHSGRLRVQQGWDSGSMREACKRDWRRGAAVAHRASQAP